MLLQGCTVIFVLICADLNWFVKLIIFISHFFFFFLSFFSLFFRFFFFSQVRKAGADELNGTGAGNRRTGD